MLKSKFNLVSKDGKTIKREDALIAIRAANQNPSLKEFSQAVDEANLEHKSIITFDDFVLLSWHIWDEKSSIEDLIQAFKKFDKDGNGYLEQKEFQSILTNYGEKLSQSELDEIMKLVDVNHDGKLSYTGNSLSIFHLKTIGREKKAIKLSSIFFVFSLFIFRVCQNDYAIE